MALARLDAPSSEVSEALTLKSSRRRRMLTCIRMSKTFVDVMKSG